MYWDCIFRWDGLELIRWGDNFLGRTRAIPTTQAMRPNTTRPNRACEDPHQRQGITSPRKNKKNKTAHYGFCLEGLLSDIVQVESPKDSVSPNIGKAVARTSARPSPQAHAETSTAPRNHTQTNRTVGKTHAQAEPDRPVATCAL